MRRSRLPLLLLATLLSATAAGCLGGEVPVTATPYLELHTAAPGSTTQFALFVNNTGTFREDLPVEVTDAPADWSVEAEHDPLKVRGDSGTTVLVNVSVPEDAVHGFHELRVSLGEASAKLHVNVREAGDREAEPGLGVHVRSVGFWDNGTVFWTNMQEVDQREDLPLGYLGPPGNMTPLKVYVGGERGEDPPERYAERGYVPVIRGFDERLHGMRAGDILAVRIAPEDAYTYDGNEDHALYGDALNFVIEVTKVVEIEEESGPLDDPPVSSHPPNLSL